MSDYKIRQQSVDGSGIEVGDRPDDEQRHVRQQARDE